MPPQGAGIGADLWGLPPPQWDPPAPPSSPPSQWKLAAPPAPQPSQGIAGVCRAHTGLAALGLLDTTLQAFAAALQGVVTAGVVLDLHTPSPAAPGVKVPCISLLHLHFVCGVAGNIDLLPI